jgi:hypothetical protein
VQTSRFRLTLIGPLIRALRSISPSAYSTKPAFARWCFPRAASSSGFPSNSLAAVGKGTTTITVQDEIGNTSKVPVTVHYVRLELCPGASRRCPTQPDCARGSLQFEPLRCKSPRVLVGWCGRRHGWTSGLQAAQRTMSQSRCGGLIRKRLTLALRDGEVHRRAPARRLPPARRFE